MITSYKGFTLREVQKQALSFINEATDAKFIGAELLTGSGKSLIAVILQEYSEYCDIITCNNHLAVELSEKFGLCPVMGRDNYDTKREYRATHKLATESTNCVFNPLSYIYHQLGWKHRKPKMIVLDEAHRFIPFIRSVANYTIKLASLQEYTSLKKEGTNEVTEWDVHKILTRKLDKLRILLEKYEKKEPQKALKWQAELMTIKFLYETVVSCAPDFTFHLQKTKGKQVSYELVITPVFVPKMIIKKFFNADKLIMLSGTMPRNVFNELCFDDSEQVYKQFEHPTPMENRQIKWFPVSDKDRKNPDNWADNLRHILTYHKNIVFHCTYEDSIKIYKVLVKMKYPQNKIFTFSSKHAKAEAVDTFKFSGGVLLACGLDEGVDFPYELCDAVVVGRIRYPYLGDQDVSKRKSQPGGQEWYDVTTASSLFQQLGRGCRAPDDQCKMYVFDPMFPTLIRKAHNQINPSLIKAIKWS